MENGAELRELRNRVVALEKELAVIGVQYENIKTKLDGIETAISKVNFWLLSTFATAFVSGMLAVLFGGVTIGGG